MGDPITTALLVGGSIWGAKEAGMFDGSKGGGGIPPPTDVTPPATRVEPSGRVSATDRRKRRRSLATQASLSEPLIKEEKLGT